MRGEDGKVYGVGLIATDVTEGLRSQEERKDLEARLHRVDRLESIGRLAGGIAHDFNNLLAVIRNYAQFLIEDLPEGSQSREDLEQIRRAVDRATSLTRQLLIFARKERSAPRPLQLNEIVGDTERLLHRTLGEDIHLRTRLDHGLPPVELDPGQAEQVLINLALNARDAMPTGGTLTISTARGDGDTVLLSVSDTGTGMSDEVADRAFEPFFTNKPEGKGTGLGLAMVYGVITGAGGNVDLETAEGEGTTLTLSLPATDEPAPEEPELDARGRRRPRRDRPARRGRRRAARPHAAHPRRGRLRGAGGAQRRAGRADRRPPGADRPPPLRHRDAGHVRPGPRAAAAREGPGPTDRLHVRLHRRRAARRRLHHHPPAAQAVRRRAAAARRPRGARPLDQRPCAAR